MAGHYHHNVLGSELLKQRQEKLGLPLHSIIQNVATLWNSTFYLLGRVVEQRRVLHDLALETSIAVAASLSREEWDIMDQLVYVLQRFGTATQNLSGKTSILTQ